jgi:hypothetical protein
VVQQFVDKIFVWLKLFGISEGAVWTEIGRIEFGHDVIVLKVLKFVAPSANDGLDAVWTGVSVIEFVGVVV